MSFIPHEMYERLLCRCGDNRDKDDAWRFLHAIRCNAPSYSIIIEAQEEVMKEIDKRVNEWVKGVAESL